jgi:predicted permease
MLYHYFKVALRNLRSIYSLINLTGLTVGLTAFLLLFRWVDDELSYDRFHRDHERIFRIYQQRPDADGRLTQLALTPALLHDYLQTNFSSIETACRMVPVESLVRQEEKAFFQKGLAVDTSFFSLFTFPMAAGQATDFNGTDKVVLSQKAAERFFGNATAVGQPMKILGQEFTVAGVLEETPSNSSLQFDFLLPLRMLKAAGYEPLQEWNRYQFHTYIKLKDVHDRDMMEGIIRDLLKKNNPGEQADLLLQPLASVYLYAAGFDNDLPNRGDIQYVYIFSSLAICILLLACINFTNLATARSVRRARETGVRKVVGAARTQLMGQLFSESALYAVISIALAFLISWWLWPGFNELSGKNIPFDLSSGHLLLITVAAAAGCALLAGLYPAVFLSSLAPVVVFKGVLKTGKWAVRFRRSLVVLQFALGIVMVISTLVVYQQLDFIRSRDIGFRKENLVTFHITRKLRAQYTDLKNELKALPHVAAVTVANSSVSFNEQYSDAMQWQGKDPNRKLVFHPFITDHDFLKTFAMTLREGRDFSADLASDSLAVILNEEAVRQMDLGAPVGKSFTVGDRKPGSIIGVVKDFNFKSAHKKIEPVVIFIDPKDFSEVTVRLKKGDTEKALAGVTAVYKKFAPDRPFEFNFVDQEIDRQYKSEVRTGQLLRLFATLAIFISCLGLLGLVMFTTEQRMKDFAIRKIMGASPAGIFLHISKEFLLLIVVANVIALPLALYGMNWWLHHFAYFAPASWMQFAAGTFLSILITWLTIAWFSLKAATASPVKALKQEGS